MRMKFYLFGFLLLLLTWGCTTAPQRAEYSKNNSITDELYTPDGLGYQLVWEDNFDGETLDTSKWLPRCIGPRRIGYNTVDAITVKDGFLKLGYDIKGDSIVAGAIGTQHLFETTYGYFECRAKPQRSIGPWASFWLQSDKISEGENPAVYGAEIDILEFFRELGDVATHSIHWAYGPNMRSIPVMKSYLDGIGEGFHLFAVEWTPKYYNFYVDGLKFHERTEGLSHIKEYMILSMELPSELEAIKNACAPDSFMVDYVRVYKKKD